jgi:hypothetical protein
MKTYTRAGAMALSALLLLAVPASARMSRMQAVETCVAQAHQAIYGVAAPVKTPLMGQVRAN